MEGQTPKAVVIGQILSLLLFGTSFSSSQLARHGIEAPMLQVLFNYVLVLGVFGSYLLYQKTRPKIRWQFYLIFAIIDVEANYLATKAYQYTSITSAMLLDCWSVPLVLLLTLFVLKTQYFRGHYIGVGICVVGLILVVVSDFHAGRKSGGSHPILGDAMVFISSTLYAINNVYEEFLVRKVDRVELLGLIGAFGTIVSAIQVVLLERNEITSVHWSADAVLPFVLYAVCLFAFTTLLPKLLQISGATMLNLSLLTSDIYAVAIRWLVYHESVDWLFFVAYAVVAAGLGWYAKSGDAPAAALGADFIYSKVGRETRESEAATPQSEDSTLRSGNKELEGLLNENVESASV